MKVGDKVRRKEGSEVGTVVKVTKKKHLSGNSKLLVRVSWSKGSQSTHSEQQLVVVA